MHTMASIPFYEQRPFCASRNMNYISFCNCWPLFRIYSYLHQFFFGWRNSRCVFSALFGIPRICRRKKYEKIAHWTVHKWYAVNSQHCESDKWPSPFLMSVNFIFASFSLAMPFSPKARVKLGLVSSSAAIFDWLKGLLLSFINSHCIGHKKCIFDHAIVSKWCNYTVHSMYIVQNTTEGISPSSLKVYESCNHMRHQTILKKHDTASPKYFE